MEEPEQVFAPLRIETLCVFVSFLGYPFNRLHLPFDPDAWFVQKITRRQRSELALAHRGLFNSQYLRAGAHGTHIRCSLGLFSDRLVFALVAHRLSLSSLRGENNRSR